jgi:hypothetical protein
MPSRNESTRARARLEREAPISKDADLLELQEQAAAYLREARRRSASHSDESISTVIDALARDYFRRAIRKH